MAAAALTLLAAMGAPKLITFDATGTLMRLRRPMGNSYRDALISSLSARKLMRGSPLDADELAAFDVEPAAIALGFGVAYKAQCAELKCFGSGRISSRDWWSTVVSNTFVQAGVRQTVVEREMPSVFGALYSDFGSSANWELMDASAGVVQQIARWRAQLPVGELKLGVISNFDDRLPGLLASLGIADLFDFIITSHAHGQEKPCASIFDLARERAGLSAEDVSPSTCVHVGDTFKNDIVGATAAGWRAIFLASDADLGKLDPALFGVMGETPHERVPTLGFIPRVIGAPAITALPTDGESDPANQAALKKAKVELDDPHADEGDEDGESAWFLGLRDDVPQKGR
ncbi:HAD-like domain-containing protein [Pavlovales sp. CCMP2436]|nr:HAD-like domain-containing protein [Pavlovales sp. CCMP2436]